MILNYRPIKCTNMKKILCMMGMAGALLLVPACKKNDSGPSGPVNSSAAQQKQDTASLYVLIDSKPCSVPQDEFTSASVDIRGIKVFNAEHGWEDLTPVPGAWDVISLQTAPVPVAEITEVSGVHTGTITKIALTFGSNNQLVVNDQQAPCYRIGAAEVVLDLNAVIQAGTLNEIVVSIDVCGNIKLQNKYDQEPCYVLKPVMAFQSFTVR
jgi:hypothetical protein